MPAKCSVPSCTSNYASSKNEGYITVFKFPQEVELRLKWIKSIHRKNWIPTNNSVVCIKHFYEADVLFTESYIDKEGVSRTFPRKRPILKENAVPKIFPGLPKYLTVQEGPSRQSPSDRQNIITKRQEEQQDVWLKGDVITSFGSFSENVTKKLVSSLQKWKCHQQVDYVYFYLINFDLSEPKIICSVKILVTMEVQVRINKNLILKEDLSWVLPSSLKLSRWS